jgi:hypothetical protein
MKSGKWRNSETDEPHDLQVCIGWDADFLSTVFVQWLSGPQQFVDAEVTWQDSVTQWRPLIDQAGNESPAAPKEPNP